jgi:curved DNA-binding protein CbpA
MKSAYLILGIPGNATSQDIEEAFAKAKAHYSPARLASDPQALDKFLEVKNAYQILRDGESRAAHDRKLLAMQSEPASANRPARPVRQEEPEPAWFTRPLPILAIVVVLVFSAGFYFSAKRETARQERAAQELALKKLAAEETQKEELRLAKEEAERKNQEQMAEQKADRQEEQMRQDADQALANVRVTEAVRTYQENQKQSAEQREAQRKEYEARARQQNIAREAQQRLASDKARIRELCYQNYRRYDC